MLWANQSWWKAFSCQDDQWYNLIPVSRLEEEGVAQPPEQSGENQAHSHLGKLSSARHMDGHLYNLRNSAFQSKGWVAPSPSVRPFSDYISAHFHQSWWQEGFPATPLWLQKAGTNPAAIRAGSHRWSRNFSDNLVLSQYWWTFTTRFMRSLLSTL